MRNEVHVEVWYDSTVELLEYRNGHPVYRQTAMLGIGRHGESLDGHDYNKICDMYMPTERYGGKPLEAAERAWRDMNVVDGTELPVKFGVRSMSIGDVVVIEGHAYVARMAGFEDVSDYWPLEWLRKDEIDDRLHEMEVYTR